MSSTSELTLNDLNIIKESLKFSKQRVEDYQDHPSYEFKQQQLAPIIEVAQKVAELIKSMKSSK